MRPQSQALSHNRGAHPAQQDGRAAPRRRGHFVEQAQLVRVVDHDAAHAHDESVAQLAGRLVVAVQADGRRGDAARQRHVQLAARDDVEAQPLLAQDVTQPGSEIGFGGVVYKVMIAGVVVNEGVGIGAAGGADGLLIVDVEGRPEARGKLGHVDAAQHEAPDGVDRGAERQDGGEVGVGRVYSGHS